MKKSIDSGMLGTMQGGREIASAQKMNLPEKSSFMPTSVTSAAYTNCHLRPLKSCPALVC